MLAPATSSVEQELLRRNEKLVTENRILRHQTQGRLPSSTGPVFPSTSAGESPDDAKQAMTVSGWKRSRACRHCG